MKDMKDGINQAISEYEDDNFKLMYERTLTARERKLIEYGYIQCALQIGCDIMTKGESFIDGLQEIVLENDKIKI